jgi:hypothetical protein
MKKTLRKPGLLPESRHNAIFYGRPGRSTSFTIGGKEPAMFRFHRLHSGGTSPQRSGSIRRSRPRIKRDRHVDRHLLRLEWLEPRTLLSTYFPNVTGDVGGAGALSPAANPTPSSSVTITLAVTATSTTFGSDAFYFTATTNDTSIWIGPPITLIIDNAYDYGYGIYARSLSWGVPFGPCSACSVYNQNDYVWHAGTHTAQVETQEGVVGGWSYSNTVDFTVTKAPVTVTANNATKKVGTADPAFSATPGVFSSLTFTTNEPQPATSAPVGTYTITPSGGTATDYYAVAYVSGTLTVTPANDTTTALALSPNTSSDVYGTPITMIATVTATTGTPIFGAVAFDDGSTQLGSVNLGSGGGAANQAIFTTTATQLVVGTHSLSAIYSGDNANYAGSTSSTSSLSVTMASLTVTANNATKYYGSPDPTFSASYSGFAAGEGPGNLSGTLTFTTNEPQPATTAPVGTYLVLPSGYGSGNYNISYATGTLTVLSVPTFTLTSPTSGTFTAGQTVSIQWTASNVAAGSTVSLCYDQDTIWWNGNETWIEVGQVAATNGNGSYSWNTTGVAPGTYYIAGYLWSSGQPTFYHLTQAITIVAAPTFALTGPTSGTFSAGQTVPIQWTASNVAAGSNVSLCYDTAPTWWTTTEHWIEVGQVAATNGNGSYNWNTTGVATGTYYVAGYLWSNGQPTFYHLTQAITIQGTGPAISGVLVMAAQGLMTWNVVDSNGVASSSLTVDGKAVPNVYGPYAATSGVNYAGVFGTLSSGTHNYTITATDNLGKSSQYPGQFIVPAALMVDASAAPQAPVALLTDQQLGPIVAEPERRWAIADGTQVLAGMSGMTIQVADLPGTMLGETVGNTILIDRDAAGYGWFVDPTPADDSEFADVLGPHASAVSKTGPAANRVDLLTTVMHEMGHMLAYNDDAAGDLMNSTLPLSVRRTALVDEAFAAMPENG